MKTALSIQNMGFMRGLSPAYMGADAGDQRLGGRRSSRPTRRCAAAGSRCCASARRSATPATRSTGCTRSHGVRSPYQKMIAALWRESPMPRLGRGERLMTMASLLHRDADGRSLVAALVEASGVDPVSWLRSYLHAYVRPIVHCLLAHDLAFMPHGENLVLVLRDRVPVRALMKDIGEEVAVMSTERPLPRGGGADPGRGRPRHQGAGAAHRRLRRVPAPPRRDPRRRTAWSTARRSGTRCAAACTSTRTSTPSWRTPPRRTTCSGRSSGHSCLNRLQLRNTLEMVDLADQAESLIYAGTLANPIAAPERVRAAS